MQHSVPAILRGQQRGGLVQEEILVQVALVGAVQPVFHVLEHPFQTLFHEVQDPQGRAPDQRAIVEEVPVPRRDAGGRARPPLVREVASGSEPPPGVELGHRRAQGLHPEVPLEDLVGGRTEEEVHLALDMVGDELPQLPHAHKVKVVPPAVLRQGQRLEGLQRARLQVRQPVGVVHHDVEDGPVPRHEVLLRRPQERLQVPGRGPAERTHAGIEFPETSGERASHACVAGAQWGVGGAAAFTVGTQGVREMTVSPRLRMGTRPGHTWYGTAGSRGWGRLGEAEGPWVLAQYFPPPPKQGKGSCALPAGGKDGQAHGEVPPGVVVPQGPPVERAFPYDGGEPARGRHDVGAFPAEHTGHQRGRAAPPPR